MDHLITYKIFFFVASVLVVILAFYASLNLTSKLEGKNTGSDKFIMMLSSFVIASGIWAMHFIGMQGYHVGISYSYNIPLFILSIVVILGASFLSSWLFWKYKQNKFYLILSNLILGIGISAMHYIGMASMEMDAEISYDPVLFIISILSALLVPIISYYFFYRYSNGKISRKIGGSVLLGSVISFMHYTGMYAISYTHFHDGTSNIHTGTQSFVGVFISIVVLFIFLVIVLTEVKEERFQTKVRESEEHYRNIVEFSPGGIAIHQFGVITYMNPAGLKIVGAKDLSEVLGSNILEFIHPDFHEIVKSRWKTIREQNESVAPMEEKMIKLDQQVIDVEMKAIPMNRGGNLYVQLFFDDITDRKRAESLFYQLAYYDPLTNLANRRLLLNRLNDNLNERSSMDRNIAVLFIDLDGFKRVNDTFGHDTGDLLLVEVGKRLTEIVGKEDTVSRLAGDEFVLLLHFRMHEDIKSSAEMIIHSLKSPYIINGNTVEITPSIGISYPSSRNVSAEILIKQADTAMYQAKRLGKNTFQFYEKRA